ncbi:hypothetical protein LXL04_018881 [Taraxacum kok-saghyz]
MAISTNLLLLMVAISAITLSSFTSPAAGSSGGDEFSWISKQGGGGGGGCRGSIAECMGAGELEMESESTRRILATTNYISYGALQGNNVPCSQRDSMMNQLHRACYPFLFEISVHIYILYLF